MSVKEVLIEIINLAEGPNKLKIINAAARLALAERERCISLVEARRQKVLSNKDDPSWTEHFAALKNEMTLESEAKP